MQINDITNLEVGNNDKAKSLGLDISQFKDKAVTNHSNRYEDVTKIGKDNLGVISMSNLTYNNPNNNTIMDELEKSLDGNGKVSTVSTLNQRNFNAIEKLGFDAKELDEKEFVDIADKIRIAMAKGGADISMMGDVSDAAIKQSGSYPQMVESALKEAQLPTDEKIVQDGVTALRKVDEIKAQMVDVSSQASANNSGLYSEDKALSDETIKYLLGNELEPTINNIYKASVCSNDLAEGRPVDISGNMSNIEAQFQEILEEAGLEVNDKNIKDCYWMISNRISVTPEHLLNLQDLREFNIGNEVEVIDNIIDAVTEGKKPDDAYLVPGYSLNAKARAINDGIQIADDVVIDEVIDGAKALTLGNIAMAALAKSDDSSLQLEAQELNKAIDINQQVIEQNGSPINGTDVDGVVAKRQLVQIQLMMSTETNFALIKRGFSIDTMQINEYVNALEELEQQFLETMLKDNATMGNAKILSDSMEAVTNAKALPDYAMPLNATSLTLSSYASISVSFTESFEVEKSSLNSEERIIEANFSAKFSKVSDTYESSATQVRKDLGDSIRKAFNNVDNILDDMGLELSEENRRAVRILGYNQMEITSEAIKEVKAIDMVVNRSLDSLKPGVVCEMIKAGLNPLDMTMEELLQASQEIIDTMEVSSEEEKFAEFLWRLEQENGITEEEREGFIGVFRLIHQVNKSDGAAIGMLLNQGAEVTMRNLLMATRTARHENREYTIDDDFGGIEGFNKDSLNITNQIEFAIQSASMRNVEEKITPYKMMQFNNEEEYMNLTPEQLSSRLDVMDGKQNVAIHEQEVSEAYNKIRREEVIDSYKADRQVIEYLEANDIPLTSNNINAITNLMSDRNMMMSTLFRNVAKRQVGLDRKGSYASEVGMEAEDKPTTLEEEVEDIIANLIHEYGEAVKTPEDMAKAQRRLEELAENAMKNMIVEEDVTTIDLKGMHLVQTQLTTSGSISRRTENYNIPIMVADEVGNMSLKIVRGREEKGLVDIAFDMEKTGTVTASFRYEAGTFVGEVNCDRESTRELLENNQGLLREAVSSNTGASATITFSWSKKISATEFAFTKPKTDFDVIDTNEALESDDELQAVLTKSLYGMARAFIEELGNL